MKELKARLEEVTCGSWVLDQAMCKILDIDWSADEDSNYAGYGLIPRHCQVTRSLDTARELLPKDATW